MRDQRYIATHRGGPLDRHRHCLMAAWAADCAEHVLPLFTQYAPHDDRPQSAIDIARAWACGEATVSAARTAATAAHAAAREATDPAAIAAARAAGHAVATAHMADHAPRAAVYALQAIKATTAKSNEATAVEQEHWWQKERLPEEIRALILSTFAGEFAHLDLTSS